MNHKLCSLAWPENSQAAYRLKILTAYPSAYQTIQAGGYIIANRSGLIFDRNFNMAEASLQPGATHEPYRNYANFMFRITS